MKKMLLAAALLFATGLTAQTTHMVDWFMGVSSDETVITIENGDTVTWTWTNGSTHTVTSQAGGAESFNSGTLTGVGQTFSHTFTVDGNTSYACNFHPSMQGTITVTTTAGRNDRQFTGFKAYPNPVTDVLTISAEKNIDNVEIYDMGGKLLATAKAATPNVTVYMKGYPAGTYIVKAASGSAQQSITVVKQ